LKGRKKNLIVLANGMKVYPENIENVACANPLVEDAVVFGLMEKDTTPRAVGAAREVGVGAASQNS
jgi:long-chain acyl-CoA synthetase